MLIRKCIRYYKLIILFLMPISLQAEEVNDISYDINTSVISKIDKFFTEKPQKTNVIWTPKINGRSRYAFSIPKDAYLISKKHSDSSELYYLSEIIDNGLTFHRKKAANLNIFSSRDNFRATFEQRFLSSINAGLFFEKKDNLIGINFNKEFIVSENALSDFGFEQVKDNYTIFKTRFVKLTKNEDAELSGNISHEFKSNIFNAEVAYTWFDIANKFDFTAGLKQDSNIVSSEIYGSFSEENVKFQIGLNEMRNTSNMNIFFNLTFEDVANVKNFSSKISHTSKNDFIVDNLTLKRLSKYNLDSIWRKYFRYD